MSGHPVATSTPRGEDQFNASRDETKGDTNTRPSSAASDLTDISTTDISSQGERDNDEEVQNIDPSHVSSTSPQKYVSSTQSSSSAHSRELTAKLSDVEVSLEGTGVNMTHTSDSPPPLPLSPPPPLDNTGNSYYTNRTKSYAFPGCTTNASQCTEEVLISPKKQHPTSSDRSMALARTAVAEATLR